MNSGYNTKFAKKSQEKADDVYSKPLPIDTVNKFWGVDSRILKHDDIVQKQSFDQAYKHFWSFVDFNANANVHAEENNKTFGNSNMNTFTGVTGMKNSVRQGNNQTGMNYMEARKRADELLRAGK